ncbi:MAG TPA: tol-pal system protein YbgF [Methylomirabilota bacterium]|jgi:tol-pal system protein YbgF
MAARSAGWLLAVVLSGCAGVADVTGTASQEDVTLLRADVAALKTAVRQLRTQVDSLPKGDARTREHGVDAERQAAGLTQRVDGLSTSLTALSQRVDDLSAKVDALSRQRGVALPPSAPAPAAPSAPDTRTARPAPSAPAPSAPAGPAPPGARSSTGALQPQDVYQAAYIDFSKGVYPLAVTEFRDFLRRYPDHELAPNAQYWIGEAQIAMARGHTDARQTDAATNALRQAVQEFRKVLANYPRSDKAPAALYKEALVLIELKDPTTAQARLQYLVDNFPQAEETPMARERLTALKER